MAQITATNQEPLSTSSLQVRPNRLALKMIVATVVILGVVGFSYRLWMPRLQAALNPVAATPDSEHDHDHDHEAAHGGHDHPGHKEENSLELSEQARRSIGLKTGKVTQTTFERTINVPGMVVERRGRSKVTITAPNTMTGVVTHIYVSEGEAVLPDQLLFEMRLTHEELVQSQADLLRTTEELDVIRREVARLERISQDGAVAGKVLLERKYEQQKQEAVLRAQQQALILHGLTEGQVEAILETHQLLKSLEVRVPPCDEAQRPDCKDLPLQVQSISAEVGQQVAAGEVLAQLSDHHELLIEGEAFEQDAQLISQALEANRPVTAILESKGKPITLDDLHIQYQANRVEPTSRALHFYVVLPNKLVRDTGETETHRFIDWLYKPGQRMTLRIPVEEWQDRIVLPVDAVAQDGIESYVFRANGDHFDRQPVNVEYRDPVSAVIANDGSIFPGEVIALSGAQQMQLALKNKSGGAIDPHAGHHH